MSEQPKQSAPPPKGARAAHKTKRTARKQVEQIAQPLEQKSANPQAVIADKATIKPAPTAEASFADETSGPRLGEQWGEFPSLERQAELEQKLQEWDQEDDHGTRPGPFAGFELSGADVFWLAAREIGAGDITAGREKLANPLDNHPNVVELSHLHLEGASLRWAQLHKAYLIGAQLEKVNLVGAQLEEANLVRAQLKGANLAVAQLERAWLVGAVLEGANLAGAKLEGARLIGAKLEGANLVEAHLAGADLLLCDMHGVDLRQARLDVNTRLMKTRLDDQIQVADVVWNDVPLHQITWEQVPRLGDEAQAKQAKKEVAPITGKYSPKTPEERLEEYQAAARAYLQLAVELRGQGITEPADRFTYRALNMQRKILWWQLRNRKVSKLGSYLFSWFLFLLTGYGFRMWRIIVAYLALILTFAAIYWCVGVDHPRDISFWTAIIVSVTAFHGRVFTNPFTPNIPDAQVVITAVEAVVGLIIEGVFIAMLTQRFFNR